jgi:SNF2 domain-containing protein
MPLSERDLNADQLRCIDWLPQRAGGIVWGDPGTGKTVCILTALLKLIAGFDCRRILVIGPRLVAERVWSQQVEEWAHLKGLTVSRCIGTPAQRLAGLGRKADIYTVTRDNVKWLEDLFIRTVGVDSKGKPIRAQYRKWPFDTIVLDESQSFMSADSQRFDSMRRIRRLPGVQRVYLATGSFIPNGYRCAWAQCYLVDGGERLGRDETAFLRRFYRKEVSDGVVTYELRPGSAETIDRLIQDIMFPMLDANPAVPVNVIKVQLSKEEKRKYNELKRQNVLAFGDKVVNAVNAGVLWGKLLQLANGAVYDAERLVHVLHTRKLEALLELLESLPRPILLGYGFQHDVDRIIAALAAAKVPGVRIIRSNESLNAWKRGEVEIGVIHPGSAGHGLNDLKDAAAVVWFGLTANREHFEQLNGRTMGGHRRAGRDIGCHVLSAEGTVDEDAYAMLSFKGDQARNSQIRIVQHWLKEVPDGAYKSDRAGDAQS